jgi:nitrate/nitrite transport system permease protein
VSRVGNWSAPLLSICLLAVFLGAGHAATLPVAGTQVVDDEYAKLVGAAAATGQKSALPGPAAVGKQLWTHLHDPFYDKGPNDKGIGIQLAYSIARVLLGFSLAALVAIPVGFLRSGLVTRAFAYNPRFPRQQ